VKQISSFVFAFILVELIAEFLFQALNEAFAHSRELFPWQSDAQISISASFNCAAEFWDVKNSRYGSLKL
jgi:hypothetical protein